MQIAPSEQKENKMKNKKLLLLMQIALRERNRSLAHTPLIYTQLLYIYDFAKFIFKYIRGIFSFNVSLLHDIQICEL